MPSLDFFLPVVPQSSMGHRLGQDKQGMLGRETDHVEVIPEWSESAPIMKQARKTIA